MRPTTSRRGEGDADVIVVPAPAPPAGPGGIPIPVPSGLAFAAVARGASRVLEAVAQSLDLQLGGVRDEAATALDGFAEAGQRLGEALQESAAGDLGALADLFGDELAPELQDVLSHLLDVALPGLSGHSDQLGEVLTSGLGILDLAVAVAPPLEWAHGTVGTIHHLLEAMALGR